MTGGGAAGRPQGRLFAGGPILTVAADRAARQRAEALAVVGDRILHAGSLADCRDALGPDHRQVDLAGRALVPGFVDAHCHPLMLSQTDSWLDVSPTVARSIPELVAVLRARAATLPPGEPLRAYGYAQRAWPEFRHPVAVELDGAATDREIYVMNASGHGGVLNSFGLAAHGITRDTPDIPGGEIGRNADGSPNGLVWDAACDLLTGPDGVKIGRHGPNIHLPEPTDRWPGLLAAAQEKFLRAGVTTVVDAQVSRRELSAYVIGADSGALRLRVEMLVLSALLDEVLELGLVRRLGGDALGFAGIKLYADGALGSGTAYFPEGYASDRSQTGSLYHEPAAYAELVRRAHAAGLQTGTHSQSPTSIAMVLDAVEAAQRAVPRADMRHRIDHCGLPTPDQVKRIAALGMVPVPQPGHHHQYGDGVVRAVGQKLGERYNPIGEFAAAGIPVVLSSDAPVSPPSPLVAIQAAVDRRTVNGNVLGGPGLRVDVATALRGHTLGAAYAIHRDHAVGSLEAGKLADLAVLTADPTAVDPETVGAIRVVETWLGGERVA
ncbi:MAG: amidohydrolase [Chloroflexota bacterium]